MMLFSCHATFVWANGTRSFNKKRGRHDNERTELRLRDLGNIWVLALAPRKPPLQAAPSPLRPRFPLYSQALQPTQVAPNRSCCGHVIVMSGLELQLTSLSTGVGETNLAFGPRPQAPKKLKKSNSYTRFCEELC